MFPHNVGYPPPGTQLPVDLIVGFWEQVYAHLQSAHRLTGADAVTAITQFRAAADGAVGDMLYHRDPGDVAETIATGWENGAVWAQPTPRRTGTTP
jgi:hypothetical protein